MKPVEKPKTKPPASRLSAATLDTASVSIARRDRRQTPHHLLRQRMEPRLRKSTTVKEALERFGSRGEPTIHDVEHTALAESTSLAIRLDAVTILLALRERQPQLLQRILASDDSVLFVEVLKRIKNLHPEWAPSVLLKMLGASTDKSRRSLIVWALAPFSKDENVEKALLSAATDDVAETVRAHAIESLSQFHSRRVADVLIKILVDGSSTERFWALYSLGSLAEQRAGATVEQFLEDETSIEGFGTIGEEARWALNKIVRARKRPTRKRA